MSTLELSQLNERQRLAWDWALSTEKNLFISGFAGTGKTALIQRIQLDLEERGRTVCPTAFTGLAAQKLGGSTVSRLLGLRLAKSPKDIEDVHWDEAEWNLNGVTDIILDEISMCSGDFLALVDQVLQRVRESKQPFGGLRMIFSGDFLQLPPVRAPHDPTPQWEWAFHYPQFLRCHGIFLNQGMRQKDPAEIRLLNQFRRGVITEEGQRFLDAAVNRPLQAPAELCGRRHDVAEINRLKLELAEGTPRRYSAVFSPARAQEFLLTQVPIGDFIDLKPNVPVIILANDEADRYANGTQGTVERLRFDTVEIRLRTGKLVQIGYKAWQVRGVKGRQVGEVEGLPLHLGWAATIHRAQGLTLNEVRADISGLWEPGQAYVALSRTPTLKSFSLVRPVKSIRVAPEVLEFVDRLEANTS